MKIFNNLHPHTAERLHTIYFKFFRPLISWSLNLLSRILLLHKNNATGLKILLLSTRLNCTAGKAITLKAYFKNDPNIFTRILSSSVGIKEAAGRTIILSLPQISGEEIQKGVLLIAFTQTLSFYNNNLVALANLDKYFVFVLEPSSAGYADADILYFMSKTTHCLIQATEISDRVLINTLYPDIKTLSFGASNWVDSNIFKPCETLKKYDSIYVANMNHIKRPFKYINAVKNIIENHDPSYQACLVCAPWGGAEEPLNKYIAEQGIEKNFTYFPGLYRDRLIEELNRSKANVLLSLKEGSNRSLFESMFVDIPVICLSENIGVNKSYINEHTGYLVPDLSFEDALVSIKKYYKTFTPRAWAQKYISAEQTTCSLKEVLSAKYGQECNNKLHIKVNRPELEYQSLNCNSFELSTLLLNGFSDPNKENQLATLQNLKDRIVSSSKVI